MSRVDDAEQRTLLAVFDDSRPARLLDAVDVGMDRATAFGEHPLVQISARDTALVTSRHSNSNQSYALNAVILLHEGKLVLVDTFLVFGERGCGFTQSQSIAFKRRRPIKPAQYDDLDVTIRERRRATREVCDDASWKKPFTRTTSAIYRWSPTSQRFLPSSDVLKRLAEKTAERF